jgi:hypothetical protein
MPWILALEERVALLAPPVTELGDVKMCLYAWILFSKGGTAMKATRTHHNEQGAAQQAVPGVLRVVLDALI